MLNKKGPSGAMQGSGHFEAELVADQLRRDGAAKIDVCIGPSFVAQIRAVAESIYAERDLMPPREIEEAGLHDMHTVKRSIDLADIAVDGRSIADSLAEYFAPIARLALSKPASERSHLSFVRTIFAGVTDWHLPFHQDQTLLEQPLLNIWIALTPCGVTAPGLEVVRTGGKQELLPTFAEPGSLYYAAHRQIRREAIVAVYGEEALWRPAFEPGDVMVFCGSTAHRTYFAPGMRESRMSIELRLV